jgi:hypothetical protein
LEGSLTKTSFARALVVPLLFATLFVALPATAQSPLSLSEAIARAKARNPDVGTAAAAEQEAAERITQVRAGYFPKVDVAPDAASSTRCRIERSSHCPERSVLMFTLSIGGKLSRIGPQSSGSHVK